MKKLSAVVVGSVLLTALVVSVIHVAAISRSEPEVLMVADVEEWRESVAKRAVWQGVCSYASEHGYEALMVFASEGTQEARMKALEDKLSASVKVVVSVGASYEPVIYEAQQRHPEVNFLLLDGEPRDASNSLYETRPNTHCLLFRENEAGFLAGYAAVMDGKRKLGFCGESAEPELIRYGYGLIQGAEAAAENLGLGNGAVDIRYWYVGTGEAEQVKQTISKWYHKGTQVIFVCESGGQALTNEVLATAKDCGGLVIPAEADSDLQGGGLLTSIQKDYCGQVRAALASLEENKGRWNADRAGRSFHLGVSDGAISLLDETDVWRFQTFSKKAYLTLLEGLKRSEFSIDQAVNRERFPLSPHCTIKLQNK